MPPAVIGAIISGGALVGGSAIEARGNTKAAETQAASDDKALAQAKEIYQQQRQDQGPYRESGYGAMDALNYGLGLPAVSRAPAALAAAPGQPAPQGNPVTDPAVLGAMPRAQANSPTGPFYLPGHGGVFKSSSVNNSGLVKVQSPSGTVHLVPPDKLQAALAQGGKQV